MMSHRQIRATFVIAAIITLAAILAAVLCSRRNVASPVEVGVIAPEPMNADTLAASDAVKPDVKRKRAVKSAADATDHHDSPLYHATPRDDLR